MRSSNLYFLLQRRRRNAASSARSTSHRISRGAVIFGMLFSLLLMVAVFGTIFFYASLTTGLPSLNQLAHMMGPEDGALLQPTSFYDRSGEVVLYTLENPGITRRYLPVSPEDPQRISPQLVQVTVAMLEKDFWQSPGFRWSALGSEETQTIAEQVASNLLVWDDVDGLQHILRVRILAAQMVAEYGRTQVLEWYLNSAYYGHLAYGAESAAQLYLGKSARDLNLAESVLLFAVSQAPALNPIDVPEAAIENQQQVLAQLHEQGVISEAEYDDALRQSLSFKQAPETETSDLTVFTDMVLEELESRLDLERLGMGGWKVVTTLDADLQSQLECAAHLQLAHLEGKPIEEQSESSLACEAGRLLSTITDTDGLVSSGLMTSGVMLDPATGEILAMLGDTSLSGTSDKTVAHQPGSLLTPFVAATAFSRGFSPASLMWDIPTSLPEVVEGNTNPDGAYHGPVRLRYVLANDYLVSVAYLMDQFGASDMLRLMEPFGLTNLAAEDGNPEALLFSGGSVTDLEVAWAYSIFANDGKQRGVASQSGAAQLQPKTVLRVESSDGKIWLDEEDSSEKLIISQELAYLVNDVFSDEVAKRPSLGYPSPLSIGRTAATKVGFLADNRQIWAVGYTPDLVSVIWMGLPESEGASTETEILNSRMVTGLWHAVMQYATRNQPVTEWAQPAGISAVNVCDPSGQLPTSECPSVVSELFLSGNEPVLYDTLYRVYSVNRESGKLATIFTPLKLVEERTYLVVPAEAADWALQAGLSVPPTDYDVIQEPADSEGVTISSPTLYAYVHGSVEILGSASGEDFLSYRLQVGEGLNPTTWIQVGADVTSPVVNGNLGTWDTSDLDGLYALKLVVEYEGRRIVSDITQVTVDNQPPQVSIVFPTDGFVFSNASEESALFQVNVSDQIGIGKVIWMVDGKKAGEMGQSPYLYQWNLQTGDHTLVVQAIDLAGNQVESLPVTFSVQSR